MNSGGENRSELVFGEVQMSFQSASGFDSDLPPGTDTLLLSPRDSMWPESEFAAV